MKHTIRLLTVTALAALAFPVAAQDKSMTSPAAQGKGVRETTRVHATIESIDAATRTVTLRDSAGQLLTFVAGEEVRNFAQLKPGDRVTMEYKEALAMRLAKSEEKVRSRTVSEGLQRAELGQMPGGTATRQIRVIASVEKIDPKLQSVTLRGPQQTVAMRVQDPAMLQGVKTGDMVEALYTESVTIKVERGAKK
jgi:Cu/Ag efflux protein CusF